MTERGKFPGRRRLAPAVLGSLVLACGPVLARECHGVAFPDRVSAGDAELQLNGLGLRKATFLHISVYVAALYVRRAATDAGQLIADPGPQQLVLSFVRSVGAGDLRKAWAEGFERSAGPGVAALEPRVKTLAGWMADVHSGERLVFTRVPGQGVQVQVGEALRGVIPGEDFARAFMGVFLGTTPPNPELKAGLLGGACD